MKWKMPPKIKILEALGCIGDERITLKKNGATVTSSSGNKSYTVTYNSQNNTITSNDNASYFVGYLGYPAIAYLLVKGQLIYSNIFAEALAGIKWKDLNVQYKNDFNKTEKLIKTELMQKGVSLTELEAEVDHIFNQLAKLELNRPTRIAKPPTGY